MKNLFLLLIAAMTIVSCKKEIVRELPSDTEAKVQKQLPGDPELFNESKDSIARAFKKGGNGHGHNPHWNDSNPPPPPPPIVHKACWLIDANGYTVTSSVWTDVPIYCSGADFSGSELTDIINRVKSYWSEFDVEITTDEALYNTYPTYKRMRVVLTRTNFWGLVGGVAYINSLNWIDEEKQCFVFPDLLSRSTKYTADATAHEMGHTGNCVHHKDIQTDELGFCYVLSEYLLSDHIMGASYYESYPKFTTGLNDCGVITVDQTNITNALNQ